MFYRHTKVLGLYFILIACLSARCGIYKPQAYSAVRSAPTIKTIDDQVFVPILVYHRFSLSRDHTDSTTIDDDVFETQLKYLKTHGYTVISLRSYVSYLYGQAPPPRPLSVVLTADDGHKSVYTDMLPIVQRYGVPVTLFIYPSAISNASYAMTWSQLVELRNTGLFDIQSHTYWHPNFKTEEKRLAPAEYDRFVSTQLTRSKEILESRLHCIVDLLAWPFGIHDDFLATKAKRAGYIAAFALNDKAASATDPMAIPRYMVTNADKGGAFERLLRPPRTASDPSYTGLVVDSFSGKGIPDATITVDSNAVQSDPAGNFTVAGTSNVLRFRAPGYLRRDVIIANPPTGPLRIALSQFRPKALYLSFYGIGSTILRDSALRLIERTELNAVVIDVKGDRGMIAFQTPSALANQVGAQNVITIKDAPGLIASLKERGIYTIARIVVFKDDPLARFRPDLAVKSATGEVWHDREHFAWIDPFRKEAWDYNIDIAVQAAAAGFDEIQFDYLRFPDTRGLEFSEPNTEEQRVAAIRGFLRRARERLIPYNVFLAADAFGYVCWNLNDTYIGQRLADLSREVDYLSPMLYPSGFQFGIPGYRNPVANAYAIVNLSLKESVRRTGLPPVRFRPWLQAFKDYAFDRRVFGAEEIAEQIRAAEDFGSDGWMLWNPRNIYSDSGVRPYSDDRD
jgi:hypothetical protein